MAGLLKNLFGNSQAKAVINNIQTPVRIPEVAGNEELPSVGFTGHVKLGVIVGHTMAMPGAKMPKDLGGFTEYAFNQDVAIEMKEYIKRKYPMVEMKIIFRDDIGIVGAYKVARESLCDCVIELHFNAFDGKAIGTSTLCTPDISDMAFAKTVHQAMCKLFNRMGKEDRGVKSISKATRGGGNVHGFPGGVNCLVEPVFGDSHSDAKMLLDNKNKYAWCLVDAVVLWAKQSNMIKPV